MHSTIQKNFYFINFVGLILIGFFLRVYSVEVNIISWPVSSLLSIYILSSLLFFIKNYSIWKCIPIVVVSLVFIVSHWVLSAFFEILLTRFFRLQETYGFTNFRVCLMDNASFLADGLLWLLFYLMVLLLFKYQEKIELVSTEVTNLEKELSSSKINLLNKEINPHFLFNAMNSISMKVRLGHGKMATEMIAALNDLLRLSLSKGSDELIALAEEIELLEKYLMIEKVRFDDDFELLLNIPQKVQLYKVPKLILQPLVENAFKHGNLDGEKKMVLTIQAKDLQDDKLNLMVYNSLDGFQSFNYANSNNIGLPNIAHRLRQFYGSNFRFKSFSEKEGIAFQITIPKKQ